MKFACEVKNSAIEIENVVSKNFSSEKSTTYTKD